MPDLSPFVSPILALVAGAASLFVAQKLGVGPVQREYVDLLKGLNVTQKERIDELEAENARLHAQIQELRDELEELRQQVFELRQQRARRKP